MKRHALAEMAARTYLCKYIINSERCPSILRKNTRSFISRPPYEGAKDYFYISDVDDREYLTALIKATIPVLPPNGRAHKFK